MTNEEFIESIRLEGEEWRDVVGYEGLYMVSSFGRVISLYKKIGKRYISYPMLRKLPIRPNGYPVVMLTVNYSRKLCAVHRLVAKAFLPNLENKPHVDHIDGNRANCKLDNLRWCTRSENMMNPITRMRNSIAGHKKRMPTKWTPIVSISPSGEVVHYKCMADAAKLGYSAGSICSCCKGKRKQHKGYRWMYLSDYESLVSTSKNSTDSPIG